ADVRHHLLMRGLQDLHLARRVAERFRLLWCSHNYLLSFNEEGREGRLGSFPRALLGLGQKRHPRLLRLAGNDHVDDPMERSEDRRRVEVASLLKLLCYLKSDVAH